MSTTEKRTGFRLPPRLAKRLMNAQVWWYRRTGGLGLRNLGGFSMIILTTTGRVTGKPRTIPLGKWDWDGREVLVASNGGQHQQANWVKNILARSTVTIMDGPVTAERQVRVLEGDERDAAWQWIASRHQGFVRQQAKTTRPLDIVLLDD